MRIGFISEHYPPLAGGVATSTQRLARQLAKAGHSVHVRCFDGTRPLGDESYVVREKDEGVDVGRVGPFFLKRQDISRDKIPEKVRASLRRRAFETIENDYTSLRIDVVLAFYLLNAGFLGCFVSRALEVPFVVSVRGNDIGRNIFHVDRFAVTRWVVEQADLISCVNQHLHDRLTLAWPEAAAKTQVIANSVEVGVTPSRENARARIRALTGWSGDRTIIGFPGSLREKKGVATLLQALQEVHNEIDIGLLVIGPDLGSLERRLWGRQWEALQSENVIVATGQVQRSDVLPFLAGCDAVVMPSLDDGMANGLLEAMTLGVCPIVSDIFADTIDPKNNGLVFPRGNSKALATAIKQLVLEPLLCQRLGLAARETVREWTPQQEASAYLDLLERAISGNRE